VNWASLDASLWSALRQSGVNEMICIKADIPQQICDIDDELKAIYHSKDTVCIWVFKTRDDRNKFMDETAGMLKDEREEHFEKHYNE
jgi:hypothetical protein